MSELPKFKPCEIDGSYCRFGNEALSKLLQAFKSQIGGVIEGEDIEFVHKMRVSSRRMRAAMPLFRTCYPRRKFKKWLSEVKKVTRLLGEARDLDVQIAFVKSYLQRLGSPVASVGLEPLVRNHENSRKAIQPNVTRGLEKLTNSGALEEMGEFFSMHVDGSEMLQFDSSAVLEKAFWYISAKLSEFLALEEYVHDETAILKHHEMRIKAKWLRYTMETFSPLYQTGLADEIQTIKAFQDVLGEMHDCDVWVDSLPKFICDSGTNDPQEKIGNQKITPQNGQETPVPSGGNLALVNFLAYIKETKQNCYNNFVQMWNEKKETGYFNKLRETAGAEFTMTESKLSEALSNPKVKIAVLSDIHANLHALESVIQDAEKRGAEVFLNAGDSIGFGAFPNEVIELLHTKNVISVVGNFDLEVIKGETKGKSTRKNAVDFARKELSKCCEGYLLSVPTEVSLSVAGKTLLMVHGSPESVDEHIYHDTPETRLKELVEDAKVDLIIVGHSHEQFSRQVDSVSFINPGSVGRPGDGNPQTGYALLSFNPFNVEFVRLDYDVEAAADALRRKKLPESFAQMLLRGLALDDIIKEDKSREIDMIQDCEKMAKFSQDFLKKHITEVGHSEHVRGLSLSFFDGLKRLHQLGERERCWLECAAILHDVGLAESAGGHHKKSMKLILNDTSLPISSEERRVVASIARYHRKGLPKKKQYNLAPLNGATVGKIMMLSSLLRVADALDYSHQSIIDTLTFKIGPKKVTVEFSAASDSPLEEQAFAKKKDLFERVFEKKLVLVWTQQ